MAQTIHELAIELQGEVDSKFGHSIEQIQKSLGQLDDAARQVGVGNTSISDLSEQYVRLDHESALTARESARLDGTLKQMQGFETQRRTAIEAANGLREARSRVRELERANKESGSKELAKELRVAKREAASAERTYNKQKATLASMSKRLQDAGVDTKNIAAEQKRLAAESDAASTKLKRLGDEMSALARRKSAFADLRKHAAEFGANLSNIVKRIVLVKAAMLGVGAGAYKLASSTAAAGDAAAKTAGKLHMGIEAFQELDYAASLSGVKDFPGMMTKMNAALAKAADGGGEAAKILKGLGLNGKQIAKMKPEIAIQVLADELNRIKDPAARARAEMALFGKTGAEMGQFMSIGSEGMRALMKEARETGGVISEETARQAEAFNDARDKMAKTFEGLKNTVGAELVPIFTDAFKEIADFFIENRGVVKEFAGELAAKFREFLPTLKETLKDVAAFIKKLWDARETLMSIGKTVFIIVGAVKIFKTAFSLGKMIQDIKGLAGGIQGATKVFGALKAAVMANPIGLAIAAIATGAYLVISHWEEVKAFFKALGDKIVGVMDWVSEQVDAVFGLMPDSIRGIVEPIFDIMTTPFRAVWHTIKTIWRGIRGDFGSFSEFIDNLFGGLFDIIVGPFKKAFSWITDAWNGLKNLLGMGVTTSIDVEANRELLDGGIADGMMARDLAHNARGGVVTTPTVSTLAERGPEAVVPLAHQDRARGVAMLDVASRALGAVGSSGDDNVGLAMLEKMLKPQQQTQRADVSANFTMPAITINISGGGTDADIRETIIETMREVGARMIPEWAEQIERCAYGTA